MLVSSWELIMLLSSDQCIAVWSESSLLCIVVQFDSFWTFCKILFVYIFQCCDTVGWVIWPVKNLLSTARRLSVKIVLKWLIMCLLYLPFYLGLISQNFIQHHKQCFSIRVPTDIHMLFPGLAKTKFHRFPGIKIVFYRKRSIGCTRSKSAYTKSVISVSALK